MTLVRPPSALSGLVAGFGIGCSTRSARAKPFADHRNRHVRRGRAGLENRAQLHARRLRLFRRRLRRCAPHLGRAPRFCANAPRTILHVPYPALEPDWSLRTWTCGVALQCAPSKKRIAGFTLAALSPRQSKAVSIVEGRVAIGWVGRQWPGLKRELQRVLPPMAPMGADLDGPEIPDQAMALATYKRDLTLHRKQK